MITVTHDRTTQHDEIEAAVGRVRAAAATAQQLDYRGLAAALEDLAAVLSAVPAADGHYVALALLSDAQHR